MVFFVSTRENIGGDSHYNILRSASIDDIIEIEAKMSPTNSED